MTHDLEPPLVPRTAATEIRVFQRILERLNDKIAHDQLVQTTVHDLRAALAVDRVVLYYFYKQWEGQVTFEALSDQRFSIFGSTGPDQCFNDEYAALYLAGRVRAIADIETEAMAPCHRDFLRQLQVRANLAVPIVTATGLWGLLIAHHCQGPRSWCDSDREQMEAGALTLAQAPALQD
ncbi:GAF domain-containing protein [Prochlorothrix hollandica]|uniref:GAF domain-containing protein n=1 Tax=Prochlorothrix hollandica TaxID=1223 RepID=UPI0033415F08